MKPHDQPTPGQETIAVHIDGREVHIAPGTTVLHAMRKVGKDVPTLCYSDRLKPYGACRVCLVEVEGGKPVASCHTPVNPGAKYKTHTPLLTRLRRNIVELIVSDHPLECLDCTANQRCELQKVAGQVGLRTPRYENPRQHNPPQDNSHPFIKMEMAKCIGCGRCARACEEVQGSFSLGMSGRGYEVKVIAGNDTGMEEADCVSCGQCVFECPVAALEEASTRVTGLPDDQVTTTCCYCAVGCSMNVNIKDGQVVNIEPNLEGSANIGHACIKGRFAHEYARSKDRIRSPLIRQADGKFRKASWDEALGLVAENFKRIKATHGPQAFGLISSARCTNEDNFVMQKFARTVIGTNSVDNCSRVCHSPSAYGLEKALGTGAGTNSFEDVEKAKLLMIVGANPTEAHPVFGARIKQAVLAGCKLIILDPRNTELAHLADLHLPLKPGSNVAVINALLHVVIKEGLVDRQFIALHTEGYADLEASVAQCTPEWASDISGVPADMIRKAARMYATSGASQVLWGLGVTEASFGSHTVLGMVNLSVVTGNIGRPGTGACPIRGQNNVQGASDMGALPNVVSGYRHVDDPAARLDYLNVWGVELPTDKGLRIPDMFEAAHEGRLKCMYIVGEDITQSDPNSKFVMEALDNLEFMVLQDIFLNDTSKHAHVVLPATTALEKDGTFTNSDRRIQRVRRAMEPLSGTKPDADIENAIARLMGIDLGFDHGPGTPVDPSLVMDEIARLTPTWRGVNYERLDELGFIQWPCYGLDHPGTAIVHEGGNFMRGKAKLTAVPWQEAEEQTSKHFPFHLTTGRVLQHYNSATMTRRTGVSQLAKAKGESLRIHPDDAKRMNFANGQLLTITSRHGQVNAVAEITESTNPGVLFMTFHYPETKTNLLMGHACDPHTGCPDFKVMAVRLEPANVTQTAAGSVDTNEIQAIPVSIPQ